MIRKVDQLYKKQRKILKSQCQGPRKKGKQSSKPKIKTKRMNRWQMSGLMSTPTTLKNPASHLRRNGGEAQPPTLPVRTKKQEGSKKIGRAPKSQG
jgi:hypothetical protein